MKTTSKTTSKAIEKLTERRAGLLDRLSMIDTALKAENRKLKEAAHGDALALLHKSGVLNDPARLRELLQKVTANAATGAGHVEL